MIVIQKPLIKTVKFVGINDSIHHSIVQDNIKSFPYANNSLLIQAQLPTYLGSTTHVVEYKVNDEGKWFEADDNLVIKINGLETNNYKFYIRTNDQQGNFSDNIEFEFKIQPKWYFSTAAFMTYVVLTMGLFLIVTVRQDQDVIVVENPACDLVFMKLDDHFVGKSSPGCQWKDHDLESSIRLYADQYHSWDKGYWQSSEGFFLFHKRL